MAQENQNFMVPVADLGVIANTATAHANLESIKTEFGLNLNTLFIYNGTSDEELIVKLDGRNFKHIQVGETFGFDWEWGIKFDDLQITNNDAASSTAANEIRISVGRTGQVV